MREEERKRILKETPAILESLRKEAKELEKICDREFGPFRKTLRGGKNTLDDYRKNYDFLINKRNEFHKDKFKQRLENLAVKNKKK